MAPKLRLGANAKCTVLIKYLHPSKLVAETIRNSSSQDRLTGAIAVIQEFKLVNRKEVLVVVLSDPRFRGKLIHAARRFVKVTEEGPENELFDTDPVSNLLDPEWLPEEEGELEELDNDVFRCGNNTEDIANVRAMGLDVDDDNEPAPENIPAPNARVYTHEHDQNWGWDGIDERRVHAQHDVGASLKKLNDDITFVGMFLLYFPFKYFKDVILPSTNVILIAKSQSPTDLGELVKFLGVWLFLATMGGGV